MIFIFQDDTHYEARISVCLMKIHRMSKYYNSNVKSDIGYHPLTIAISGGDNLLVESMLQDFKSMITPSLLMKATEQAAKDGHVEIVANLTLFNVKEYKNLYASNIPIMNAARNNHFQVKNYV